MKTNNKDIRDIEEMTFTCDACGTEFMIKRMSCTDYEFGIRTPCQCYECENEEAWDIMQNESAISDETTSTLEEKLDRRLQEDLASLKKGIYYYVEWRYSNYEDNYGELEGYSLHTATPKEAKENGINSPGQMWTYKIA